MENQKFTVNETEGTQNRVSATNWKMIFASYILGWKMIEQIECITK